jgi:predicted nucleic-acid-binding protein
MIAVDTNILARFYVDDPADPEAAKQRPIARRVLSESTSLFVPKTVVLELEWVLRAFYGFGRTEFARVVQHLIGLPHAHVEDWEDIHGALQWHLQGLDFADALHLASSVHCDTVLTFDDKRFARKAKRLTTAPKVHVPT